MLLRTLAQVLRLTTPQLQFLTSIKPINAYSFSFELKKNATYSEQTISQHSKQDLSESNLFKSRKQSNASVPSIIKLCQSITNLKGEKLSHQIPLLVQLQQSMKRKRFAFEAKQFTALRDILKCLDLSGLISLNLMQLKTMTEYYLLTIDNNINKPDQKYEKLIYESFLRNVEQADFKTISSIDLVCHYKYYSRLSIVFPHLHNRVPKYAIKQLEEDKYTIDILLHFTFGLSRRPSLIKDQCQLLIGIYKALAKRYEQSTKFQKIKTIKQIIQMNAQSRFGLAVPEQQLILRSFLNELQSGQHSVWQNQIYKFLKNDYEINHPIVSLIEDTIIIQIIDSIDSTGHMQTPLIESSHQFEIFTQYSRKYAIQRFDTEQQIKIFLFFKQYLQNNQKEGELLKQFNFSLIVSNKFFKNQGEHLQLLVTDIGFKNIVPRLLYELSLEGVPLKVSQFMQNRQRLEDMMNSLRSSTKIQMKELYILMAAKLQSALNSKQIHFQQIHNACILALNRSAAENSAFLLNQLVKLPHFIMHKLYELASFEKIIPILPINKVLSKYHSRNAYLYIVIKYSSPSSQEQIKPLLNKYLNDDLIAEILSYQLKSNEITRTISLLILKVLNTYVGQTLSSGKSNYLSYMNICVLLDYVVAITRQFKKSGKQLYQSPIYYRYWQLVFTLLMNFDKIVVNLQWTIKFKCFIDILLVPSNSHFNKTYEYQLFLKKSLGLLKKLRPNFETIVRIISANIYCGHINEQNVKLHIEDINPQRDMRGQIAEIIQLWSLPTKQQSIYKAKSNLAKVINSHREYSEEEFNEMRQEIVKNFNFNTYLKALASFNLSKNSLSRSFFLFMLTEFKQNYANRFSEINFAPILFNINKYLNINEYLQLFSSYGVLNMWLLEVLNHHSQHFSAFSLEYHAELIASSAKLGAHSKDYEKKLMNKVWEDINTQSKIIIVTNLAKSGYAFDQQQLKGLTQLMLTSQLSFLQAFLLLEPLFSLEIRHLLAKKILQEQKIILSQLYLNNRLVHNYFKEQYGKMYQCSAFEKLATDRTYQSEWQYCSSLELIQQSVKEEINKEYSLKYQRGAIGKNHFIRLGQNYVFGMNKGISNCEKESIRSLLASMMKISKDKVVIIQTAQSFLRFIQERVQQVQQSKHTGESKFQ